MLLLTYTPTANTTANREAWLNLMADKYIRPMFKQHGYIIPTNVRLSCSLSSSGIHTKKHQKKFTLGECYSPTASGDNTIEIMIVPTLADSAKVIDVLIHELCHATVGNGEGHNKVFGACARAVGLEGKLTSTHAGDALLAMINQWVQAEGEYPHARLSTGYRKQTTRLHKCDCYACGYTMRISSKWLKLATPRCPLGHGDMTHDFLPEYDDGEGEE
jgi:hypothetical protein